MKQKKRVKVVKDIKEMKKMELAEILDDIEKVSFYKEDNIIKTQIESSLITIILDIVNSKPINRTEKRNLFNEIISIVCEIKAKDI